MPLCLKLCTQNWDCPPPCYSPQNTLVQILATRKLPQNKAVTVASEEVNWQVELHCFEAVRWAVPEKLQCFSLTGNSQNMDDIGKYQFYDMPGELKRQCFLLGRIFKSLTDTFLEYNNCSENRTKSEVNASEKSHTLYSLIRWKFYITGEGANNIGNVKATDIFILLGTYMFSNLIQEQCTPWSIV